MQNHFTKILSNRSTNLNLIRYIRIIHHRLVNLPTGYAESHHIIPRSLQKVFLECDIESSDNIVKLTAREHYICHKLLSRIDWENTYVNKRISYAYCCMAFKQGRRNRDYTITSREYEFAKKKFSKIQSENHWTQTPEGRIKITAITTKRMRNRSKEEIDRSRENMRVLGSAPKTASHKKNIGDSNKGVKKTKTKSLLDRQTETTEFGFTSCLSCKRTFNTMNYFKYHGDKCGSSSTVKDTVWYFNELSGKRIRCVTGEEPLGFVLCGVSKFYNNGIVQVLISENQKSIPVGFVPGKLNPKSF